MIKINIFIRLSIMTTAAFSTPYLHKNIHNLRCALKFRSNAVYAYKRKLRFLRVRDSLFACKITNHLLARPAIMQKRYRIFFREMSRISRIAAKQVTRVINMQKTVNFDAARYFDSYFPPPSSLMPCVSVSIFSRCERGQSEYLTSAWSDLSGWDLFFTQSENESGLSTGQNWNIFHRLGEKGGSGNFDEKKGSRGRR